MVSWVTKEIINGKCAQRFYTVTIHNKPGIHKQNNQYLELIKQIIHNKEQIIFEKVFSRLINKTNIDIFCNTEAKKHPFVFIEGTPIESTHLAYIQIYTVKSYVSASYINNADRAVATKYTVDGNKRLYVAGIYNDIPQKKLSDGFRHALLIIDDCLDEAGMDYNNLVRTWFYLGQIYENYSEFNMMRKNLYEDRNINYSEVSNELPASTCIEGYGEASAITTEFLCYDKNTINMKRIYNRNQNEADGQNYLYSPTFSRAQCLTSSHFTELQISGTASIGTNGDTVHLNNSYKQIEQSLINVRELLRKANMDFQDICIATCFFKHEHDYHIFDEILRNLNITAFPHIKVKGNVCRDNLLFEIDGIAIINNNRVEI